MAALEARIVELQARIGTAGSGGSGEGGVASSTTGGSVDIFSVNGEFQGVDLSGGSTKVCNKRALAHSTLFSPNWSSHDFSFSVLCVRSFPTHWP